MFKKQFHRQSVLMYTLHNRWDKMKTLENLMSIQTLNNGKRDFASDRNKPVYKEQIEQKRKRSNTSLSPEHVNPKQVRKNTSLSSMPDIDITQISKSYMDKVEQYPQLQALVFSQMHLCCDHPLLSLM